MPGEFRHSLARWVAIIGVVGLAGCTSTVSERIVQTDDLPQALNSTPMIVVNYPNCLTACFSTTEVAIEEIQAAGATGAITGGAITSTLSTEDDDQDNDTTSLGVTSGGTADPPMPIPSPL